MATLRPGIIALAALSMGFSMAGNLALGDRPSIKPTVFRGEPGLGGPQLNDVSPVSTRHEYVPNRVLVRFRRTISPSGSQSFERRKILRHPSAQGRRMRSALTTRQLEVLAAIGGTVRKGFQRTGWLVIETEASVGAAVDRLYASGEVAFAEPDFIVHAADIPDDPSFDQQWALNNTGQEIGNSGSGTEDADIDAPEGWDDRAHARSVIVGVVDTGVDYEHEDLADNMWRNPNEEPGNDIDDDGNGYVDDIYGVNTISGSPTTDPSDDNFHGTHVAGIAGAVANNGIGVAGVAREVQIVALKFLSASGSGATSDAIAGIEYMLDIAEANGYQRVVLNNSWGGGGFSQALQDTIVATRDAGFLFVAAAGNDNVNNDNIPHYPSAHKVENIISVGSTDFRDMRSGFSNYGCSSVDVFAPGSNILSTFPNNEYSSISGTSMATPQISGIAALVWSKYSSDGWSNVKNAVTNGVEALGILRGLAVTQGRANLRSSLLPSRRTMPTVWEVAPAFAPPGGEVVIRGSMFGDAQGTIRFAGADLDVQSWSDSEIRVVLPPEVDLTTNQVRVTSAAGRYGQTGGCLRTGFGSTRIGQTIVPHGRHAFAQSGRKLWLLGGIGFDGVTTTGLVERYDIVTGQSTIESKWFLPQPVHNAAAAIAAGGIHVVGGRDGVTRDYVDSHQVFRLASGTWSEASPLPEPLSLPSAGSAGGKLYVFGGFKPGQSLPTSAVSIYDPATDEWTEGEPLPTAVGAATVLKLPSGRFRVIGGGTSSSFFDASTLVQEYNPATDTWLQRSEMLTPRIGAVAGLLNGEPAVMHGFSEADGELFRRGRWRPAFAGSVPLFLPSIAVRGNEIYIVAGSWQFQSNGQVLFMGYQRNIYRTTAN